MATLFFTQKRSLYPGEKVIFLGSNLSSSASSACPFRYSARVFSDCSSELCCEEYTYPIPRRELRPMSHIQPAFWAVDKVADAMGESSFLYGTWIASAVSLKRCSPLSNHWTPCNLSMMSPSMPEQSIKKSPVTDPARSVLSDIILPDGSVSISRTVAKICSTRSFSLQWFFSNETIFAASKW